MHSLQLEYRLLQQNLTKMVAAENEGSFASRVLGWE
jgi:hypothetical protein